jgi:hypothetical protein
MAKPQIQAEPKPPFPDTKLAKPGIEAELEPRPKYQAPRYKPAGKPSRRRWQSSSRRAASA